jgi:hypothetical protein
MKATAFFHEYVNQLQIWYFHTQSNAEFQDPFLQKVLYTHVYQAESEECAREILEDDAAFYKPVSNYKNVVTHFFAFKKESCLPTVLHNIYDIEHYVDVNKFSKGRAAIHGHGTGYSNTIVEQKINDFLVKLVIDSYWALKETDEFIEEHPEP